MDMNHDRLSSAIPAGGFLAAPFLAGNVSPLRRENLSAPKPVCDVVDAGVKPAVVVIGVHLWLFRWPFGSSNSLLPKSLRNHFVSCRKPHVFLAALAVYLLVVCVLVVGACDFYALL